MAEQPPLSRIHVVGYSANDRDFPILNLVLDPRVAGYQVPKDLSACPDKRYPNHVFTGAQPISGDQRVRHVWEILPSPWVPFTRYDDDLGPVQGRRRSVKNEGQVASLTTDKRTTYEAREGSAIVYTELEETWEIKVDEDGNSLFPIRDRNFYDPSRGPVQERRQLFVPTGEEEGSLENVNGVITQTSYEPYNEFLSVKIVQTYKVDGPQLIGNATNDERQLLTVITQRKAADNYTAPQPTATRTVEINREDAETVVERIVDAPEVFSAKTFAKEANDPAPAKFRVAVPTTTSEENVAGQAQEPTLGDGDISKSEQQVNKFVKRIRSTFRNLLDLPKFLTQKATNNEGQVVSIKETLQLGDTSELPTATKTVESEALGDGTYIVRTTEVPEVFGGETFRKTREDITPQKFKAAQEDTTFEQTIVGTAEAPILAIGEFVKSEQQINKFLKRISTTSRDIQSSTILNEKVLSQDGQIGIRTFTLAAGEQKFIPSATLIEASVEALGDGRTVKTETVVPQVFPNKTIRKTKEDLTPQKFRAAQSDTIVEENVAGTITDPNSIILGSGEFAKSEEQVTQFVKRTSTTSRISPVNIQPITETIITTQGQIATRTLRLSNGNQSVQPDALLIDGSVEALGDGRTVKTETRVPSVFANKSIQKTKADLTPQKFKAAQEDTITEETIVGTISPNIILSAGEFNKSEQQITEFTKRVSTNVRNIEVATDPLVEKIVTPQGQIATRTLTLSTRDQLIEPDALLVDGSIEALGDGRTIKSEIKVDEVFDNKTLSASKPEILPERFRASVPAITIQETVEQESVSIPELSSDDLEKSETRLTDFTVRKSKTSRNVSNTPTLNGMDYEESFDVQIPYTETIQQTIPTGSAEAIPLDNENFLVREYDPNYVESYLSSFLQTYPTTISMNLPRVLESITVEWDEKQQAGEYANTPFANGILYQFSSSDKGESSAFHSATPLVSLNFKDIWSQNIPATVHIFFLKNPVTEAAILAKTGSQKWPTFKPKSHVITGKGVEIRATASAAASISVQQSKPAEFGGYSDQSRQGDYSRSVTPITINIPPCLHGGFNINQTKTLTATALTEARTAGYGIIGSLVAQSAATASDTAFVRGSSAPTSPPSIPTFGIYLIESSVEFFKYGFSIVRATTINASVFA